MKYAELHCISNFTFLRGASHPEELIQTAKKLNYEALAITDECSLSGIVRAHVAAKKFNIKLIIGTEIKLDDELSLVFLVQNKKGYENLSNLITHGRRAGKKGEYILTRKDISNGIPGCCVLWHPKTLEKNDGIWLSKIFGNNLWISIRKLANSSDNYQMYKSINLAQQLNVPSVATGNVHMHKRNRRYLQDVLTSIRLRIPLVKIGYRLHQNGECHLRTINNIQSLYPREIIDETVNIANMCSFTLEDLNYQYPNEVTPQKKGAGEHLAQLSKQGLINRFKKLKKPIPKKVISMMNHEISLIRELKYEHYFLTVNDIVHFAKKNNILCQGRGSAANSVVCFALGITEVDPSKSQLLFERFISKERKEPPDIDVDFEHDRREEVIQYIYRKYGPERAALTAAVVTYRIKSAIRDVSKTLDIKTEKIDKLLKIAPYVWWNEYNREEHLRESGFNPNLPSTKQLIKLTELLIGFPRHLSQHVGGFVISEEPLSSLVPIENTIKKQSSESDTKQSRSNHIPVNRTIIQWDKNDLDALNILKIDILSLGMLSVINRSLSLISHVKKKSFGIDDIPQDDTRVYEMISKADTIGIFQIESRAQMSMLPRLKPKNFYDLVIQIAIVRPGPIQGGMVHPYLKRRQGIDPVTYPSPAIKKVLERTLGIPIFQEQVMQIAITAAGFSPGEADQLRRSISGWRSRINLEKFKERLTVGMLKRGYSSKFAQKVFNQILGFGEYGFPESHAASFALLVYASAWLKYHHPAIFLTALLNSQPMGFYAPAQLIQDARRHNVTIKPVDAMISEWDSTLETTNKNAKINVRLGLRLIKGLSKKGAYKLIERRSKKYFKTKKALLYAAQLSRQDMQLLAASDALLSPDIDRRSAIWLVTGIEKPIPIFYESVQKNDKVKFNPLSEGENIYADYKSIGLTLRSHPLKLLRPQLDSLKAKCALHIKNLKKTEKTRAIGIVINRQRPSSGKGVLFITLEDETGFANIIVWPKIADKYRRPLLGSQLMLVEGYVQKENEIVHLIANHVEDHSELLGDLISKSRDFH